MAKPYISTPQLVNFRDLDVGEINGILYEIGKGAPIVDAINNVGIHNPILVSMIEKAHTMWSNSPLLSRETFHSFYGGAYKRTVLSEEVAPAPPMNHGELTMCPPDHTNLPLHYTHPPEHPDYPDVFTETQKRGVRTQLTRNELDILAARLSNGNNLHTIIEELGASGALADPICNLHIIWGRDHYTRMAFSEFFSRTRPDLVQLDEYKTRFTEERVERIAIAKPILAHHEGVADFDKVYYKKPSMPYEGDTPFDRVHKKPSVPAVKKNTRKNLPYDY